MEVHDIRILQFKSYQYRTSLSGVKVSSIAWNNFRKWLIFLTRHLKHHNSKTVGDINSRPILIDSSGNFASIYLFGTICIQFLLFFINFSWESVPLQNEQKNLDVVQCLRPVKWVQNGPKSVILARYCTQHVSGVSFWQV